MLNTVLRLPSLLQPSSIIQHCMQFWLAQHALLHHN
jgi:hypothetical protein